MLTVLVIPLEYTCNVMSSLRVLQNAVATTYGTLVAPAGFETKDEPLK